MGKKIENTKTSEQRKAEAKELQALIVKQVEELKESGAWAKFLKFSMAFHTYSLNNQILIWAQLPIATRVAGYRAWQKLGRQVRKGEKGIKIFGGRTITEENEETEEEETRLIFFPVTVFDISQTDLVDPEMAEGENICTRLEGNDNAGIFEAVKGYLTSQGWKVSIEEIPGQANGYTTKEGDKKVVIREGISPAQQAKTALHEAAHVILHMEEDYTEYIEHRGVKETEAESVAYIVANQLGLDTTAYSIGYIAGWAKADTEVIKKTAANVLYAAQTLLEGITA